MNHITLRHSLTTEAIQALFGDAAQVVRVKEFYGAQACDSVAQALVNSPLYGEYVNAKNIGRVGMAFFEAASSEALFRSYQANAKLWLDQMRALSAPYLSPVDQLRVQFDEVWPAGANLAWLNGRPMFSGLIRVFDKGAYAEPHIDNTGWDAEAVGLAHETQAPVQIAANVYLQVPAEGGELKIWDCRPDRVGYEARRLAGTYGLRVDDLGEPTIIKPEKGELILFDSRRVHAVGDSPQQRITASTFIISQGRVTDPARFLS